MATSIKAKLHNSDEQKESDREFLYLIYFNLILLYCNSNCSYRKYVSYNYLKNRNINAIDKQNPSYKTLFLAW